MTGWNAPKKDVPSERYGTYPDIEGIDLEEALTPKNGEEFHEGINELEGGGFIDVYKTPPKYEGDIPENATIRVTMKKDDDLKDMLGDEPKSVSKGKGKGM